MPSHQTTSQTTSRLSPSDNLDCSSSPSQTTFCDEPKVKMQSDMRKAQSRRSCIASLTSAFIVWRSCLLVSALLSPGIGYDTSSSLLVASSNLSLVEETPSGLESPILKSTRWDAIYYTSLATQGHVYEQEWAFGIGLSSVISTLTAR